MAAAARDTPRPVGEEAHQVGRDALGDDGRLDAVARQQELGRPLLAAALDGGVVGPVVAAQARGVVFDQRAVLLDQVVHDLVIDAELDARPVGEGLIDDHAIAGERAVDPARQRGAMEPQAQARAGDHARAAHREVVPPARVGDERARSSHRACAA